MPQPTVDPADRPTVTIRKDREISGSAVVIGMLTLGVMATSVLFIYFELHTGPFRPLREAIGREFRHSRPNVEGGRLKGRGPMILRISMSVPFDPFVEDQQAKERNAKVLEIAGKYQDLPSFEQVQVNLIYFAPETTAKRRTFDYQASEVVKPAGRL